MHDKLMRYGLVAAAALVGGLLLAGTPVQAVLPFLLLLACPLMMIVMMRGMGGPEGGHSRGAHEPESTDRDRSREHEAPVVAAKANEPQNRPPAA